jgi:allantoate deiminase
MNRRQDALAAAAKDVLVVREVVGGEESGRKCGLCEAEPGAISVIPGRAAFPVELRDLDAAKIDYRRTIRLVLD